MRKIGAPFHDQRRNEKMKNKVEMEARKWFNNGIALGMLYGGCNHPLTPQIVNDSFLKIWNNIKNNKKEE